MGHSIGDLVWHIARYCFEEVNPEWTISKLYKITGTTIGVAEVVINNVKVDLVDCSLLLQLM